MKKNWIIGISASVVGLLLLISPAFCVKIIVVLLGLTAVIEGFYGIISERTLFENDFFKKTILYRSIGSIVIGLLAVIMPLALAGTAWTIMTFILAFYLIVSGCAGFFAASKLKQDGENSPESQKQLTWENLITLGSGILLLVIGPEKLGTFILRLIGLAALLVGIGFLVVQIIEHRKEVAVTDIEIKDDESEVYTPDSDSEENK